MKTILLAGGLGTRIREETEDKPKPMTLISGKPLLLHLMEIYQSQGFCEFIIALGYKGEVVKRWLNDLVQLSGDMTFDFPNLEWRKWEERPGLNSVIHAIETGLATQTGGRIAQSMRRFPGERVFATYGDGLANVDLTSLLSYHTNSGNLATVTAVRPPARFGHLKIDASSKVTSFGEKNQSDEGWINGGFFVLEPEVEKYVKSDNEPFETGALPRLASEGLLGAFLHDGFWQPMDTLREKHELERFAQETPPPWLCYGKKQTGF